MKKQLIKRIVALIAVVLIVICIITTLIFAVTGNKNLWGMFVITILLPILLWGYLIVYRLFNKKD